MSEDKRKKPTDTVEFYVGIISMFAGIFFLLSRAVVHSSFGMISIGGFSFSSGLVVIPLVIGVIWLILNPKSFAAKMITIFGVIAIIGAIIVSLRISFTSTSMFDYLVMILLMALGGGFILRSYFKNEKEE